MAAALVVLTSCGDDDALVEQALRIEATAPEPPLVEALEPFSPVEEPVVQWPLENVHVTSYYGWRTDPVSGKGTRLHRGLDLRGAPGELVLSIAPGSIAFAGNDLLLGNMVIVDHGRGIQSWYGHMEDLLVVEGTEVEAGAAIGLVGNTGRSQAAHLHLTVKVDGVAVDPLLLIGRPLERPELLIWGPPPDEATGTTGASE